MLHSQPANGYDPRFTNDYRTNNTGWGLDPRIRSLPAHGIGQGKEDKHALKSMVSGAGTAFASMKNFIQRHWSSSQARTTRTHSMTAKPSLTTAAPAYSNLVFVLLCGLWYSTSALSSNTGKAILNQFRYPVTLTFIQFGFVAFYCLLFMSPIVRFTRFRAPTKAILQSTIPMGMFQVGGHMFSSIAISRIPVSTVHTIKVC
jgi:solute carrier family 35 protein E1